jgi:uncharacterized protein (TIGR03083 family)
MGTLGDLYAEGRARIVDLVAGDDGTAIVPTCPRWTVKEVLAHLAGIPADIIAGNVEGAATDPWTQAQVDARRDRSVAEVVAEWRETGPTLDAMIDSFGLTGEQLLFDLTAHEHDIRLALGRPGARDAAVLDVVTHFITTAGLRGAIAAGGLAPLTIDADGSTTVIGGDGAPGASLTTTRFELMRAYSGRRSAAQVAAMGWTGDASPYIALFGQGIFSLNPADVVE